VKIYTISGICRAVETSTRRVKQNKGGHCDEVTATVTDSLNTQPDNLDLKRFCNTIIEEIKRYESISVSKNWTIDEIKNLCALKPQ